ncbi:MAG: DUF2157 domain-containing protein [Candidatus Melainabacteria bacterium]|nr:DUF2157 domain-containing protein [Candidatus Melainabacteria bacterium]
MANLTGRQQLLLAREIDRWHSERIIDDSLAARLKGLYPDRGFSHGLSSSLTLIGAILVGLGALLFIAANWQAMTVAAKLAVMILATLIANYSGWCLRFEPGKRPRLGEGLLMLGCLFYGGSIWLIAQTFNFDVNFSTGLLLWSLGALASALSTRIPALGCLTAVLTGLWAFDCDRAGILSNGSVEHLPYFLVGLIGCTGLAFYLRSPAVVWINMVWGGLWLMLWSPAHSLALLLWGVAILGAFFHFRETRPVFSGPFLYGGSIATLGALLILTAGSFSSGSADVSNGIFLLLSAALVVLMVVAVKQPARVPELAFLGALAVSSCLFSVGPETSVRLFANVALLGLIAGMVYTGLKRVGSAGMINVAIVFFVFDIISRYFDFFYTMMDRSVFFLSGGVVLMVAGTLAERGRRKMVDGLTI